MVTNLASALYTELLENFFNIHFYTRTTAIDFVRNPAPSPPPPTPPPPPLTVASTVPESPLDSRCLTVAALLGKDLWSAM